MSSRQSGQNPHRKSDSESSDRNVAQGSPALPVPRSPGNATNNSSVRANDPGSVPTSEGAGRGEAPQQAALTARPSAIVRTTRGLVDPGAPSSSQASARTGEALRRRRRGSAHRPYRFDVLDDPTSYWNAYDRPRTPPNRPSRVKPTPDPDVSGVFAREQRERFARHYRHDFGEDIRRYSSSPASSPNDVRRSSQASSSAAARSPNTSNGCQPSSSSATVQRNSPPPASSSPTVRSPDSPASGESYGNAARWFFGQMEQQQVPTNVDVDEEERKSEADLLEAFMELSRNEVPAVSNPTTPDATMNSAVFPAQQNISTTSSPSATSAIRGSASGLESSSHSANMSSPKLPTQRASMEVDEKAESKEEPTKSAPATSSPSRSAARRNADAEVNAQIESAGESDSMEASQEDVETSAYESFIEGRQPQGQFAFGMTPYLMRRCQELLDQIAAAKASKLPSSSAAPPPSRPFIVTDPHLLAKCRKLSKAIAAGWAQRRGLPPPADSDDSLPCSSADSRPRGQPFPSGPRLEEKMQKHAENLKAARARRNLPPPQRKIKGSQRHPMNRVEKPVPNVLASKESGKRAEVAVVQKVNPNVEGVVSTVAASSTNDDASKEESGRQDSDGVERVRPESEASVAGPSVEVPVLPDLPNTDGRKQSPKQKKKRSKCPSPSQVPKKKQAIQRQPDQPSASASDRSLPIADLAANSEDAMEADTDPSAIQVAQSMPNVVAAEKVAEQAEFATEHDQSPVQHHSSDSIEAKGDADDAIRQEKSINAAKDEGALPEEASVAVDEKSTVNDVAENVESTEGEVNVADSIQQNASDTSNEDSATKRKTETEAKKQQPASAVKQGVPSAVDPPKVTDQDDLTTKRDEVGSLLQEGTSDSADDADTHDPASIDVPTPQVDQPEKAVSEADGKESPSTASQPSQKVDSKGSKTSVEEKNTADKEKEVAENVKSVLPGSEPASLNASVPEEIAHPEAPVSEANENGSPSEVRQQSQEVRPKDSDRAKEGTVAVDKVQEVAPTENVVAETVRSVNPESASSIADSNEKEKTNKDAPPSEEVRQKKDSPRKKRPRSSPSQIPEKKKKAIQQSPNLPPTDATNGQVSTDATSADREIEIDPVEEVAASREVDDQTDVVAKEVHVEKPKQNETSGSAEGVETPNSDEVEAAEPEVNAVTDQIRQNQSSDEKEQQVDASAASSKTQPIDRGNDKSTTEDLVKSDEDDVKGGEKVAENVEVVLPSLPVDVANTSNESIEEAPSNSTSAGAQPSEANAPSSSKPSAESPPSAQSMPDESSDEYVMIPTRRSQLLTVQHLERLKERDARNPRPQRNPSPEKTPPLSANDESNARRQRERDECEAKSDSEDEVNEKAGKSIKDKSVSDKTDAGGNGSQVEGRQSPENIDREAQHHPEDAASIASMNTADFEDADSVNEEVIAAPDVAIAEGDNVDVDEDPYMYDVPALDDYDPPSDEEAQSQVGNNSDASNSSVPISAAPSKRRRRIVSDSGSSSDDEPPARRQRRDVSIDSDAMETDNNHRCDNRWCEACHRGCPCPRIPNPNSANSSSKQSRRRRGPRRQQLSLEEVWKQLELVDDLEMVDLPAAPLKHNRHFDIMEGLPLTTDRLKKIIFNDDFQAALYEDGEVVFQGRFPGVTPSTELLKRALLRPVLMYHEPEQPVDDIEAGDNYIVMLTREGHLLSVGGNDQGQLGASANPDRYRQRAITPASMRRFAVPKEHHVGEVVFKEIAVVGKTTWATATTGHTYICGEGFEPLLTWDGVELEDRA
uniref:HECT domain-containing protein n=1 Tax=Panagrellus redivivus TaxID=6233 RepID=A0A7E4W6W1_PANRE